LFLLTARVNAAGFNAVEIRKILIEHYLVLANDQNPLLDRWDRNQLQRGFLLGLATIVRRVSDAADSSL
jgi:hypothetical protein